MGASRNLGQSSIRGKDSGDSGSGGFLLPLSESKRGPQMRWWAQGSPWPLPAFASCGDSCRARRPEPLGQRNNCLVFSPKMKIATSLWPGVHRAGGGSCPGAMAGAWACGRCHGTTGQSEPQGRAPGPIPGPNPASTGCTSLSEEAALLSSLPTFHFSSYPVMCQPLLIPWEPAPAPEHIYQPSAWAIFCISFSSKGIQTTF